MKKRLSNIDVFQTGKVLGVLYFCIGLIVVPFLLIGAVFGLAGGNGFGSVIGAVVMAILMPLIYGFIGFVGGLILALIYNLVAGWTGGIEFTVTDVAPVGGLPGSYSPTPYQQ